MLIALAFIAFMLLVVSWVAAPSQSEPEPASSPAMPMHSPAAAD